MTERLPPHVLVTIAATAEAALAWHCPFAALTGLPCPGCGATRALVALAHGDVVRAFHIHPVAPLVAVVALGLVLLSPSPRAEKPLATALIGLSVVAFFVWIARFYGALGGPVPV